jgi:hypothetical protein
MLPIPDPRFAYLRETEEPREYEPSGWDGVFSYDSTKNSPVEEPEKDLEWIDHEQIKGWIQACDERHNHHCQPPRTNAVSPNWLIDCQETCLVRANLNAQYVALSYVWGNSIAGQAGANNIESLQVKRALLDPSIPKTIRDVIQFLNLINERYLWVDRLCILQDDDASKAKHINNMAFIYSNARMTLVAAVGQGADSGLLGIQGITPPFERDSHFVLKFKDPETGRVANINHRAPRLMAHQLTRVQEIPNTKWYSRGWTLQEAVFSRRILYLSETGAFWECHCDTWSEDTSQLRVKFCKPCKKAQADIFRDSYFPPWPNLHMYLQLVAAYNMRQLGFDHDILAGFAGITTSLSTAFLGGFLYGLPELFLDIALLWRPLGHCRRRKPARNDRDPCQASKTKHPVIPSWSWVGWQSEIDPLSWKCGYDYIATNARVISWPGSHYDTILKTGTSWTLKPTVHWHVTNEKCSPIRPVIGDYKTYQRSGTLPEGWSRYSLPFESPEEAEYLHSSDTRTRFRFPIPIPSPKEKGPATHEDGPYLYFQTTVATFFMDRPSPNRIVTSLTDDNGKWVGVLRLNLEKEPLNFSHEKFTVLPELHQDRNLRREQELITISEGNAKNSSPEGGYLEEWNFHERPKDSILYEFVNVLSVTRKNGVCYREGIGRVLKESWLQKKPKTMNVILG